MQRNNYVMHIWVEKLRTNGNSQEVENF